MENLNTRILLLHLRLPNELCSRYFSEFFSDLEIGEKYISKWENLPPRDVISQNFPYTCILADKIILSYFLQQSINLETKDILVLGFPSIIILKIKFTQFQTPANSLIIFLECSAFIRGERTNTYEYL